MRRRAAPSSGDVPTYLLSTSRTLIRLNLFYVKKVHVVITS